MVERSSAGSFNRSARHPALDEDAPWRPPMRSWQVYVLFLLGFYLPIWIFRTAQEIRRHHDSGVRPWCLTLVSFLGVTWPFVAHRLAKHVRTMNETFGRTVRPSPAVIALIAGILSYTSAISAIASSMGAISQLPWLVQVMLMALYPMPWIIIQRQFDSYKICLDTPKWSRRPYRFAPGHYALMSFGVLLFAVAGYGIYYVQAPSRSGEILKAGIEITGKSGLYSLKIPKGYWTRAKPGTIADDADLEIFGPTRETWVIARVMHGEQLDNLVRLRRIAVEEVYENIIVRESWDFLSNKIPISYVRYESRPLLGLSNILWVATAVTNQMAIEVMAETTSKTGQEREIEALIKSLALQ